MQNLSHRVAYVRVLCTMLLMVIPSVAMATSFTFSNTVNGGGTFSGSFTVTPDPDPLNFTADNNNPPPSITTWTFEGVGLAGGTDNFSFSSLVNSTFTSQSLAVSNGTLVSLNFSSLVGDKFVMFRNLGGARILTFRDDQVSSSGLGIDAPITLGTVPPQVPEPTSIALFATGLLGLARYRWALRQREGIQAE